MYIGNFLGATEISPIIAETSVVNYKEYTSVWGEYLRDAIKEAEDNFTPSLWDKILRVKSYRDKYNMLSLSDREWWGYEEWMYSSGKISLSDEAAQHMFRCGVLKTNFRDCHFNHECEQISALLSSGNKLYLNPAQTLFIKEFSGRVL